MTGALFPDSPLRPTFTIGVVYDGDEWPPTCNENVLYGLHAALTQMQLDGMLISYEVELRD